MQNNELQLDELVIQIIRKPIKHLYIKINPPDGTITVSIPMKAKLAWVQQHLENKKEWIRAHCTRLQARASLTSEEPENQIYFLGKSYPIIFQFDKAPTFVRLVDEQLHYNLPANSSPEAKQQLLDDWYRQQFKTLIAPLISKWEPILNVRVHAWGVRAMKTRWGSCNIRTKKIWLNLNLIKKPVECIEYVVVHEMVHLLEASHNRRFYALMGSFLPEWKNIHRMLEPNSRKYR